MTELKLKKVFIAAAGTGGHVFPGVAIAVEMKRLYPEVEIVFVGTSRGIESKVLSPLGFRLILMRSSPIKGARVYDKMISWLKLPFAVCAGMNLISKEGADLLISVGGYAAGPLMIASVLTKLPFVILEPNAIAGFTNRKMGRFARGVFLQFSEAKKYFKGVRAFVTGDPVRQEILDVKKSGVQGSKRTVFVFGGSQGARKLNEAMTGSLSFIKDLKDKISVIHQTGANDDWQMIKRAYEDAGFEAEVFPFTDRIWDCYSKADIVVARSGATTTAEVSLLGLPSLLVPYPYAADDHQKANAESMARTGGAKMILNDDCTAENLSREIRALVEDPARLSAMSAALKNNAKPDAARRIVEESFKLWSSTL